MDIKRKTPVKALVVALAAVLLLSACGSSNDYSPKPRGYYRIVFPKKEYRQYVSDYPFTFMYPTYAVMEKDTKPQLNKRLLNMNDLLNMQFPQFNGTLHISYETITSKKVFDELLEDAHKFAFRHTVKASGITETTIRDPARKVYGLYYAIDGNAASSAQFYLTDSVHNYLRGALYFNTPPRLDSIQPVLNFVKKDMDVMIKSFRWK